ncbi:beta-lactamase family protein [Idiomarina sp. M1R2S28]|uniref:Beta-lactamase family protein n=1 Tax=Idiomarina rhizosphaerae TaxID=2961572 RepID=A0A9X2FYD2_9GAMM|nr:serine hydrolase [Idiomarina rhizosphaerae]MCP1340235.1 beta-lactamase family protein [Idiomarina rhizosphaerae]
MRIFLVIFLVLLSTIIAFNYYPRSIERTNYSNEIDLLAKELIEDTAIPGLAIAQIRKGDVDFIGTYGYADIDSQKPVNENTLFNVASISKPILGLALLELVKQGKLSLDKDINEYLSFPIDNPHVQDEVITVRHLASHSSGIADYYNTESYTPNRDPETTLKQHLISLLTTTGEYYNSGKYYLPHLPGEERHYSNLAAALAGQLVEEVSGLTLAEFSKLYVFPRLGMENSSWLLGDLDFQNIATPYEVEQCIPWLFVCANTEEPELNYLISKFVNPPREYKRFSAYPHFGNPQYPDGGLRGSIKELSSFMTHLLKNKDVYGEELLSRDLFQEFFALQLEKQVSDSQRFFWRDREGLTGHMGSDLGVFAAMYFDLNSQSGFIIVMNRGADAKAGFAMQKLAAALMVQ